MQVLFLRLPPCRCCTGVHSTFISALLRATATSMLIEEARRFTRAIAVISHLSESLCCKRGYTLSLDLLEQVCKRAAGRESPRWCRHAQKAFSPLTVLSRRIFVRFINGAVRRRAATEEDHASYPFSRTPRRCPEGGALITLAISDVDPPL